MENLSRSERARTCARANHAKNDTQKGCAMQLKGITLTITLYFREVKRVPCVVNLHQTYDICKVCTRNWALRNS